METPVDTARHCGLATSISNAKGFDPGSVIWENLIGGKKMLGIWNVSSRVGDISMHSGIIYRIHHCCTTQWDYVLLWVGRKNFFSILNASLASLYVLVQKSMWLEISKQNINIMITVTILKSGFIFFMTESTGWWNVTDVNMCIFTFNAYFPKQLSLKYKFYSFSYFFRSLLISEGNMWYLSC